MKSIFGSQFVEYFAVMCCTTLHVGTGVLKALK